MKGSKLKRSLALLILLFLLLGTVNCFAQQKSLPQKAKSQVVEKTVVGEYNPPQPIATEGGPVNFMATLFKFAFSLVVVIVLVYITIYILNILTNKYRPSSILQGGMFDLLDSFNLGANRSISLLGINDKRILILSVSEKDVALLDKIENSEEVKDILAKTKDKLNNSRTFGEHFKLARKKSAAEEQVKAYLKNVTGFFQGLKKDK
jgi:flagellar biogenesis protein FliO